MCTLIWIFRSEVWTCQIYSNKLYYLQLSAILTYTWLHIPWIQHFRLNKILTCQHMLRYLYASDKSCFISDCFDLIKPQWDAFVHHLWPTLKKLAYMLVKYLYASDQSCFLINPLYPVKPIWNQPKWLKAGHKSDGHMGMMVDRLNDR